MCVYVIRFEITELWSSILARIVENLHKHRRGKGNFSACAPLIFRLIWGELSVLVGRSRRYRWNEVQYGGGCIVGGGRGYKEISLRRGEILAAITVFLAILAATRLILLYRSSCIPFFRIPLQQPAVSLSPSLLIEPPIPCLSPLDPFLGERLEQFWESSRRIVGRSPIDGGAGEILAVFIGDRQPYIFRFERLSPQR